MNKSASIGIAILVIAVIIGVLYSTSSSITNQDNLPVVDENNLPVVDEEVISEDVERTGTDFSVELTEKIGMKSP